MGNAAATSEDGPEAMHHSRVKPTFLGRIQVAQLSEATIQMRDCLCNFLVNIRLMEPQGGTSAPPAET
eukprot:CAMPEP_0115445290 /NCGR_PEP_ID=MMETSP0271-20121206/38837_1 /TAXON_ID=71861 /ORGANISM="Scrippsiella trochoidea, Strain CCMP3099" /LENGTH=67 /DNA_ID=CAMNT_0002871251 /DNA_START=35 /DNA_END=235 /DNA_ORIENTATION=-